MPETRSTAKHAVESESPTRSESSEAVTECHSRRLAWLFDCMVFSILILQTHTCDWIQTLLLCFGSQTIKSIIENSSYIRVFYASVK